MRGGAQDARWAAGKGGGRTRGWEGAEMCGKGPGPGHCWVVGGSRGWAVVSGSSVGAGRRWEQERTTPAGGRCTAHAGGRCAVNKTMAGVVAQTGGCATCE